MNGSEGIDGGYELSVEDKKLVALTSGLLERALGAPFMTASKMVSVAKVLHVLRRLPRVSAQMDMRIDITGPTRLFGDHRIRHDWSVELEDGCIIITSGGYFFRPSTGGDSFTCVQWMAWPDWVTEYNDYSANHRIVDDIQPFASEVEGIDFLEPGYSIDIHDDENVLLEEDEEYDEDEVNWGDVSSSGMEKSSDDDDITVGDPGQIDAVLEYQCIQKASSIVNLADMTAVAYLDILPDILPPTRRINIQSWQLHLAIACTHFAIERLFRLKIGMGVRDECILIIEKVIPRIHIQAVKFLYDCKYACDAALERLTEQELDDMHSYSRILGKWVLSETSDVPSAWVRNDDVAQRIGLLVAHASNGWWED